MVGVLVIATVIAVVYVGFLSLIANMAKSKGRDPVNWILLSLLFSPLLVLLLLLVAPPLDPPGGGFRGAGT